MRTDDGYIIHRCLNGDPEAFGILVDRYKEGIYAYVHTKLRDWHDAQDVSQEVFIQAFRKLHTLKRWDSFSGWLFRIASNYCKNWQLSKSKRPDSEYTEDQDPAILDKPSIESHRDNQMIESVREALSCLPETYREVLTLYYFGNMDSNKIAEILSTSPVAIRHRLSRARAQLKEEVLTMMGATFQQEKLKAGFTFRIVEAIKHIKIHPISTMKGLPWGLSLATGIMIAVMSLNPYMSWFSQIGTYLRSVLPSETKVLKIGEIPVDIIKVSNVAILSSNMGKGKGGEPKQPDMQNTLFMAPQGEGGEWVKKADMPTARFCLSTSVVNGKIYAIGGESQDFVLAIKTVEEYDPAIDKWTRKADMPTARFWFSTSMVDGKIYAIGGGSEAVTGLSTVEVYNPLTDTWAKCSDMPTGRRGLSTSVVNGKIYAIGGDNKFGASLSTVEEYDPVKDTWAKKANMPTGRAGLSTSVVDGKIYAICGIPMNIQGNTAIPTVEVYDPATDKWTKKADTVTARNSPSACVVNGQIYVIGGNQTINGNNNTLSSVEVYNPATDKWTGKANMLTARGALSASEVNGKIYSIGGYLGDNVLSTVEEYTPEGWPFAVSLKNKLSTTWGSRKK